MSKYVKFTDEEIYKAAHASIKGFLECHGEEVTSSGTEYSWKKHDSVKFRDYVWYQHSTGEKGTTIDFLCNFFNMSFPDAVLTLLDCKPVTLSNDEQMYVKQLDRKIKSDMIIPQRNENNNRAIAYLCKTRGISYNIIQYFIDIGIVYESRNTHNVVFAGKDKFGNIKHCAVKGTLTNKPFKGEITSSDKSYAFNIIGRSTIMYIFEAPIDLLSYISLKRTGKDWRKYTYLATCGMSYLPINRLLIDYPYINTLIFCYDNDIDKKKNRGQIAANKFMQVYEKRGFRVKQDIPNFGDWNDILKKECGLL